MAGNFGDVLRGLGSVLNPQVLQQVEAEDRQQQEQSNQIQRALLQQEIVKQSPEYQMKVEALKNERGFREAATQAGGDPVKIASAAAQFGKPEVAVSIYNQQEARAQRLQQAHDSIELRRQQLEQAANDKSLDRDMRERANATLVELKKQGLALQAQIAQGNQDLKRMQFEMQTNNQTVQQTRNLGRDLEKANLPEADAVLGAVEDALKKNPNIASFISGPKSVLPDMVVGTDIAAGRQAFQKLFNITLKNRSGAAVTNQELERLKSEFAAGAFKTPEQLQKAVEQARDIINKHYTSIAGGYGKDILDAYNENIRGLGGRVVINPSSGGNVLRFDAQGNPIP